MADPGPGGVDAMGAQDDALQAALAIVRDPVCIVDDQLRFLYVNPAGAEYLGRPAAELVGRTMGELFPQLAGSPLAEHLDRVRATRTASHFQIESRLHPGRWYDVHLQPRPERILIYYRDVTGRRRDAQALATSEQLMRIAQAMSHVGSWVVDGALDRGQASVAWSDEMFRIFGYEPGEIVPSIGTFFDHVHPDDRGRVDAAAEKALRGRSRYEIEYRVLRKDGAVRVLHQWGVIEDAPNGRGVRVLGACQDVTEARARDAAVREAQEQLQLVTDTMAAEVARCSREGRYLWVSRAYARARGFEPEQMMGRTVEEMLGAALSAAIEPYVARVLSGERFTFEQLVEYRDRGAVWVQGHYVPTYGADGRPDGWVALVVDIDERRRAEQALREADRRKDDFLATLAHELRNPLAPIRNAVHVLGMIGPEDARLASMRTMIERQVGHMARLLDDLLDVSRISRGKVLLRKQPVDLRDVVRAAAEDLRTLFERGRLDLQVSLGTEPVPVVGDPTRLAQMLGNLLQNAAKFTNPGGHVTVALHAGPATAFLSVADDGIGMDAGLVQRLFVPFSQGDGTLERSGGLGLGLALVRGLAELHGGGVEAASPGPGSGSTFTIRLPLARQEALAGSEAAADRAPARSRSVLIVEDNRDVAESLRVLLDLFGHRPTVAHSGPAALQAAMAARPEVVLCDIGLPGGMDGYAVARALRAQADWPLQLIALTGYGQEEDRARAASAGFDRHLTKPVDPVRLRALLEEGGWAAAG